MLLQKFRPVMGPDYEKYRNHVYRVFSNCLLLDEEKTNAFKYSVAAVFHDIGIWTDHTFDYRSPSIAQVRIYLAETPNHALADEISAMIYWHHKISPYKGDHEQCVEVFRKADWMDVSLGVLSFGADQAQMAANRNKFPNRGFHLFLLKQSLKNFVRHPLNPLPIFKK
ncbi:phosphohydrolase [Chitinophaga barathri]|uniref:Phosphohydrolase n=2 Tax=Chitinophaga barathri TaxID=1647451 RepID=A0A3N4MNH9_9BACT|nr:phosphohydrolase [Chitinophaga barathri]